MLYKLGNSDVEIEGAGGYWIDSAASGVKRSLRDLLGRGWILRSLRYADDTDTVSADDILVTCTSALLKAKRKRVSNDNESHLMSGKMSFKKASIGATQQQKNGGTRRKAGCRTGTERERRG